MKTENISSRALRPLLLLGSLGIALLVIDLIFIKTNLTLPPHPAAVAPPPFALTVAQTLNLLLLAFPAMGFYRIVTGRVTAWAPILLGSLTFLAGFLSGGGTLPALLQGTVYGLGVLGLVQIFYGGTQASAKGHLDDLHGAQAPDPPDPRDLQGTQNPAQTDLDFRSGGPLRLLPLLASPARLLAGYGAFGVHLGVGLLFLWVAALLGATGDDSALLARVAASPWPWLLPLAIGLSAALFEELVFRKWLGAQLSRYTRSWVMTAFLSSLLWSLTHLQYSVSPWYLRLIEIALFAGPVSFWLYKKYGLSAAILGHFLYNAFLVCFALVHIQGWQSAWIFLTLLTPLLFLAYKDRQTLEANQ